MSWLSSEQTLVDLTFSIGLKISSDPWFKDKTREEVAEWIRLQL